VLSTLIYLLNSSEGYNTIAKGFLRVGLQTVAVLHPRTVCRASISDWTLLLTEQYNRRPTALHKVFPSYLIKHSSVCIAISRLLINLTLGWVVRWKTPLKALQPISLFTHEGLNIGQPYLRAAPFKVTVKNAVSSELLWIISLIRSWVSSV
jgi:hypothetical protein